MKTISAEKRITRKNKINDNAEFIAMASHCEFNHLWKCMCPKNSGGKCTEICGNYKPYKLKHDL